MNEAGSPGPTFRPATVGRLAFGSACFGIRAEEFNRGYSATGIPTLCSSALWEFCASGLRRSTRNARGTCVA